MTNVELDNYRVRTRQALIETQEKLEKEMNYQPENRNKGLIEFYGQHIAKLESMLRSPQEELEHRIMLMNDREIAARETAIEKAMTRYWNKTAEVKNVR